MPLPGFGFLFAQGGDSAMPAGGPAGPEVEQPHDHDTRKEVNAVMTDVMPWLVSLMAHLGVIIVAFFLIWATVLHHEQEDIIVPSLTLGDTPGTPMNLTTPLQPTEDAASSRRTQTRNLVRTQQTVAADQLAPSEIGAAAAQEAMASPFGSGPRPGDGFDVGFFGTGGNARNIVFVIDASGSMIDTMPFVIDELKRSIAQLDARQRFDVIFYQSGQVVEVRVPRRGMKEANSETKAAVLDWIDLEAGNVVPGGQTDPRPALQMAFGRNPDLIFLLSDNIIGARRYALQPDELVADVERLARGSQAKLNTIQFYYRDPMEQLGQAPTLQRISSATGGQYRFVDGRSLERR